MNNLNSEEIMLSYGTNCKEVDAKLSTITLSELAQMIGDTSGPLVKETNFLRTIRKYSSERYRAMKTRLPFVSCSMFNNGKRGYNSFIQSVGWIIDLDGTDGVAAAKLEKIVTDERVTLTFISPSGQGIKLLFLFESPVRDARAYSEAYKVFANHLAMDYDIAEVIDRKNSDVSRICFLCHDEKYVYKPEAIRIDINDYIPETIVPLEIIKTDKIELPEDKYRDILKKLGTRPKLIEKKPYVPQQLLEQRELITSLLEQHEIQVTEIEEIQYGLKIKCRKDMDVGEILIYYGKKGYRIMGGARKGLNQMLNETCRQIIQYALI